MVHGEVSASGGFSVAGFHSGYMVPLCVSRAVSFSLVLGDGRGSKEPSAG